MPDGSVSGSSAVQAVFGDLKEARAAIDALEAKGIDAGEITLRGPPVERAATSRDTHRRDARVSRYIGTRSAAASAIGAIVGGGIGLLVTEMAHATSLAIGGAALGGVAAGAAIGLMAGGVSSIDMTPGWELTFEPVEGGRVVVEVRTADRDEARLAADVLERRHPIDVRRSA